MPSIIFETFGEEESIELDLTKANEKEIKEAFIKSIKQTYFFILDFIQFLDYFYIFQFLIHY